MRFINPATAVDIVRAIRLNASEPKTVIFVSMLLRPREIKMATALRQHGWTVILLYTRTTPFSPSRYFDLAIRLADERLLHRVAKSLQPRVCHVFSGAVDETVLTFCRDKPGPVVIDLNDIFAPSLFNYLQERFEPTRECLRLADGLVCRDLQPKFAARMDGFTLPRDILLFPEYSWIDGPAQPGAVAKREADEVHVVSVGTFTLEADNMHDSAYLQLARMLCEQRIHLHIYPHWFYRDAIGSAFRFNQRQAFRDFYKLQEESPYLHMHDSLPIEQLALELPQYDFGIVAGGSAGLGQTLNFLKPPYMKACYSGRIADYLDARLPVLINPEVEYNYRLLKRYGVLIDLNGLFQGGFREELLRRKHDPETRDAVEKAARRMSLEAHAPRLADFYERVIADAEPVMRFPVWLRAATRAPVIGPRLKVLRDHAAQVPSLRKQVSSLDARSQRLTGQLRRLTGEMRDLKDDLDHLSLTNRELTKINAGLQASRPGAHAEAAMAPNRLHHIQRQSVLSKKDADEISGLLNWGELTDAVEREQGYGELMRIMRIFLLPVMQVGSSGGGLSAAWELLNRKNLDQLLRDGYRRFRRTVALNYFTFPVLEGDPQITQLEALLDAQLCARLRKLAAEIPDEPDFLLSPQEFFRYHTLLLWHYALTVDTLKLLDAMEEPEEGRPITVPCDGKRASQDLANSVIEYYSMREGGRLDNARRVLEIGGGYGRNAFVFQNAHPRSQYVLLDIPPALYIAQRYLSSVFRDRKIFKVTDFQDFIEVRDELEASSLVFLLPHQIALLPPDYFDLTINISSFGEMTMDQIKMYFAEVDRVTKGQFYTKQWCESHNPFDRLVLKEEDYPVMPGWREIYSRRSAANDAFFEALYDIGGEG